MPDPLILQGDRGSPGVSLAEIREDLARYRRFASAAQLESEAGVDAIWAAQEAERLERERKERRRG